VKISNRDNLAVVGAQWGDEGKGKIVDLLAGSFDGVARFSGGHNAGHTVRVGDRQFALHLVPSGIIHPGTRCFIGPGLVVDPLALSEEIHGLEEQGLDVVGRLVLSSRSSILLPTHAALDRARESGRGRGKIGTTGRGIGPAYQDLASRRGLRAWMLRKPAVFENAARALMEAHNRELERLHERPGIDIGEIMPRLIQAAAGLAPMIGETGSDIRKLLQRDGKLLLEGAQGVLLDPYWGTYPFVTSSSCLPAFGAAALGLPMTAVSAVLGVMKAYTTRVGSGPFPTEDFGETGRELARIGNEFGTTTGRPRRCGFFDAVAARWAVDVAGIDGIALTKIDVLDSFDHIRIATAYEDISGTVVDDFPADADLLANVRVRWETLPGWERPTAGLKDPRDLDPNALAYIRRIEELLGVPVVILSTGPRREETLILGDDVLSQHMKRLLG